METLVLRLALAPSIVLLTAVVQRRLGPLRGGRIIGLPLTTGPFVAVLCLQYGPTTAAHAAAGVVPGQMVVVGFCVGYGHLAARVRPLWALVGALSVGAGLGAAVSAIHPVWLETIVVLATITAALATWPIAPPVAPPVARPVGAADPDGPADSGPTAGVQAGAQTAVRMAVVGGLVGTLAAAAKVVGATLAGILASAPVILSVVVPTAHRTTGPDAARDLVRGTLASMPGAVLFATVLAYTLDTHSIPTAFVLAAAALTAATLLPLPVLIKGFVALRQLRVRPIP